MVEIPEPLEDGRTSLRKLPRQWDVPVQAREAFRDISRLTRLISILSDAEPHDKLLNRCLLAISELFLADIVVLLDPVGTGCYAPLAVVGLPEEIVDLPFSEEQGSLTKEILRANTPVSISVTASDNTMVDAQFRLLGVRSIAGLPVNSGASVRGMLILARCHAAPFIDADIGLLRSVTHRIGQILIDAQRSFQLGLLVASSQELTRHLEKEDIAVESVKVFPILCKADASVLVLRKNDSFCCAARRGISESCSEVIVRIAEYLLHSSRLDAGSTCSTENVRDVLDRYSLDASAIPPIETFLAVPLFRGGAIEGILFAMRISAIPFPDETKQIALLYAENVSGVLANADHFRTMQRVQADLEKLVEERTLELQVTHSQLLHAEKLNAVGCLSASIAHEFNNPLQGVMTIIKGFMQSDRLSTKDKQLADLAINECGRMRDLIRILQDFNRPSSRKLAQMDLHASMDSMLLLEKKEFKRKNIDVKKEYAKDLPPIYAVADQIKQVFLNLLNNAAEACGEGGTITIGTALDGKGSALITISDSGPGIPADIVPQIFDPFFTTKASGTGLGLSVSYDIVRDHGGSIAVASEPGSGTTFTVVLPIRHCCSRALEPF